MATDLLDQFDLLDVGAYILPVPLPLVKLHVLLAADAAVLTTLGRRM